MTCEQPTRKNVIACSWPVCWMSVFSSPSRDACFLGTWFRPGPGLAVSGEGVRPPGLRSKNSFSRTSFCLHVTSTIGAKRSSAVEWSLLRQERSNVESQDKKSFSSAVAFVRLPSTSTSRRERASPTRKRKTALRCMGGTSATWNQKADRHERIRVVRWGS